MNLGRAFKFTRESTAIKNSAYLIFRHPLIVFISWKLPELFSV